MLMREEYLLQHTAFKKQSIDPLYTFGLFIILVFTTSAGVLMVAAISPAQPLRNKSFNKSLINTINNPRLLQVIYPASRAASGTSHPVLTQFKLIY